LKQYSASALHIVIDSQNIFWQMYLKTYLEEEYDRKNFLYVFLSTFVTIAQKGSMAELRKL
jgi:hypothetical protein